MDSLTCKRVARRLAKNQSQSKALSPNSSREQALPYPYIYAAGVQIRIDLPLLAGLCRVRALAVRGVSLWDRKRRHQSTLA